MTFFNTGFIFENVFSKISMPNLKNFNMAYPEIIASRIRRSKVVIFEDYRCLRWLFMFSKTSFLKILNLKTDIWISDSFFFRYKLSNYRIFKTIIFTHIIFEFFLSYINIFKFIQKLNSEKIELHCKKRDFSGKQSSHEVIGRVFNKQLENLCDR